MDINYIKIYGLFNKFNVELDLEEECNILAGANGVGKSTLLRIVKTVSEYDFVALACFPFKSIDVHLSNSKTGRKYKIESTRDELIPSMEEFQKANEELIRNESHFKDERLTDATIEIKKALWEEKTTYIIGEMKDHGWFPDFYCSSFKGHEALKKLHGIGDRVDERTIADCCKVAEYIGVSTISGIKCYSRSAFIEKLINKDEDGQEQFNNNCSNINYSNDTEKRIEYLDLVPGFMFDENDTNSMYTSVTFEWLHRMRQSKEEFIGEIECQNGEEYSKYDNYEILDDYDFDYNYGIPLEVFLNNSNALKDAWKGILRTAKIKQTIETKQMLCDVLRDFIYNRSFDLNTLISCNYYTLEFVESINQDYAQLLSNLTGTFKETYHFEEEMEEIYKKVLPDAADLFNIDRFVDMFDKEEFFQKLFSHYLVPIIADPDFNNRSDRMNYSKVRAYAFLLLIGKAMDKSTKNQKIVLLEKAIQKYITSGKVSIYPSGLKIVSNFSGDVISLNELSSGEKKIILMLSLACFMDDYTFLIDEPELSLSIVWQKNILKDMLDFKTLRNLTIATQSPFLSIDEDLQKYVRYLPQEEYDAE